MGDANLNLLDAITKQNKIAYIACRRERVRRGLANPDFVKPAESCAAAGYRLATVPQLEQWLRDA